MDKLYVLFRSNSFLGVFTTHRKATQAVITDSFREKFHLTDYSFQFGTEFFTYTDSEEHNYLYELMEVTPDEPA